MAMMTMPHGWERDVACAAGKRLCADAREALAAGRWTAAEVRSRLEAQERRLTADQRVELWMAVIGDPDLADMLERAAASHPGTRVA